MKVLVTGATGFIGSHLISKLRTIETWRIRAVIRSQSNQKQLPENIESVAVGNIDRHTDWKEALQNIDTVIHLAGRAHILDDRSANSEAEFIEINTEGTANLTRQSIQAGVKHLIFISSIGAMATLSEQTLTEVTAPQPDTPYGRSKLEAERQVIDLARDTSLKWTILRPTLVYGAGNPGNMAMLVKLIQKQLPLPFSSIDNRRNFLYVGNLVDAIATCLTDEKAQNQLFLIADSQVLSTPQLIAQIARAMKLPVRLIPISPSFLKGLGYVGDLASSILDKSLPITSQSIDKLLGSLAVDNFHIRQTLNWQPPYTTEDGLNRSFLVDEFHKN
jgi:nucleoside-diphosphate-sugar epimerase